MARRSKDSLAEVRVYSLKLLSYRARSTKEMLDKLRRKGFDENHIKDAVEYLQRTGLIDDEALASDLYRQSTEYKSLSKHGTRQFLAKRGIDRKLIDKAVSAHTPEIEEKAAFKLVEKKIRTLKKYPEDVVRRRLWGMLQRRGFSIDIINRAINSITP
jgi:regulatory protein